MNTQSLGIVEGRGIEHKPSQSNLKDGEHANDRVTRGLKGPPPVDWSPIKNLQSNVSNSWISNSCPGRLPTHFRK